MKMHMAACQRTNRFNSRSSSLSREPIPLHPVAAFGPQAFGWGSWDWVGADIHSVLGIGFTVHEFDPWEAIKADVVVIIKHRPPDSWIEQTARLSKLVYTPVDAYATIADIDADSSWLYQCARIVVHCEGLRKYFAPYAPVEYLDHHVKFVAPIPNECHPPLGNLLWIGVRSNLAPLVRWTNENPLPLPLDVLTNLEDPDRFPTPREIGFNGNTEIRIHHWSPERHIAMTAAARAAIDIKGDDFRSRHKPPAKAIDFIASGVPLAMNQDSSSVEHLARMGFEVAEPRDIDRWLSREYWEETRRFGAAIRELLSLERVARRWKRIIDEVLAER